MGWQEQPPGSGNWVDVPDGGGGVQKGALKTLGGYVYQFDGGKWYNTGVRDQGPSSGVLEYDAQGRAYRDGRPDPRFDNPTKVAGYRAPSAPAAPTQPHTYTDRNGDVVGINPFTGGEMYRIAGVDWPKISPQEQRQITLGDAALARTYSQQDAALQRQYALQDASLQRDYNMQDRNVQNQFTSGENALTRAATAANQQGQNQFTSAENATSRAANAAESALGRQFQSGESALSRAYSGEEGYQNRVQQASQFLANYEISKAQEARAQQAAKLDAARTFTSLSASPDLTGYARFLAAGGGDVGNAINAGGTSLTREGQLGAARALQTAETPIPSLPGYSYTPERNPYATATNQFLAQPLAQPAALPPQSTINISPAGAQALWAAQGGGAVGGAVAPMPGTSAPPLVTTNAPTAAQTPGVNAGVWAASGEPLPPGYAYGTDAPPIQRADPYSPPPMTTVVAGDSTDPMNPASAGARPEAVTPVDPPGPNNATVNIDPLTPPGGGGNPLAAMFRSIGDVLDAMPDNQFAPPPDMPMGDVSRETPRFAYGTDSAIQPGDDPYLDRVFAMRQATPYSINPFAADYFQQSPTQRSINETGAQVATGVPGGDFAWEAARYQPQGLSRDALSLGM